MSRKHRSITMALAALAATVLILGLTATASAAPKVMVVGDGITRTIESTTNLNKLVLGKEALVVAPLGKALTLTVNGVETGGVLESTPGVNTIIVGPATYLGNIVLTVCDANMVDYQALQFPFRQALYLDATGIVESKSIMAAVVGKKPAGFAVKNIQIRSTGQDFDGIFVAGGHYSLANAKISLQGNGRSDFVGYGAAIVVRGEDTRLVVDGARITNTGVVRTGVVADQGSNVIVKNSYIQTNNGEIPSDYVPTIDTTQMREVPWMLGLSGNVRATNLLGTHTKASYINSYIGSQGWGVLSTDGCIEPTLTVINSTIAITGKDGYGSYGIGNATENFLGCTFDVATYATISRGSFLHYGDSDSTAVEAANISLDLGLKAKELARIPVKPTVVNSQRFGIMWHGGGTLDVDGGTVFNTKETTFLDKGQAVGITVDGSEGVKLKPGNGVIFQLMEDDDPGPQTFPPGPPGPNTMMLNNGVYHEPTGPVVKNGTHDPFVFTDPSFDPAAGPQGGWVGDAAINLSNITVTGNFYNGMRGDVPPAFPPGAPPSAKNMAVTCDNVSLTGLVTSSTATHGSHATIVYPRFFYEGDAYGSPLDAVPGDYRFLGEVTNTASETVNNGAFVSLSHGSKWTVTGDCYLTYLSVDATSSIAPVAGHGLTVYFDGAAQTLNPGTAYDFEGHQIFIDVQ